MGEVGMGIALGWVPGFAWCGGGHKERKHPCAAPKQEADRNMWPIDIGWGIAKSTAIARA